PNSVCQPQGVARWERHSVDVLLDQVQYPRDPGPDAGDSGCERLQEHSGHALAIRWQDDHVEALQEAQPFRAKPEEPYPVLQAVPANLSFEGVAGRSISEDKAAPTGRTKKRKRPQQDVHALAGYQLADVTDGETGHP